MEQLLSIGEFAQHCGLSRSALRFYDQNQLLAPRSVDADTGYRFYAVAQLEEARLIRRLRAAEMPVALLREYLGAPEARRAELLERHVRAFRDRVQDVEHAVAELRADLGRPDPAAGRWCEIGADILAGALEEVRFAMADPAQRPELAAIWLETRDQSLRLVSSDSYRLAVRDLVPDAVGAAPIRAAIASARLTGLLTDLQADGPVTLRQDRAERLSLLISGQEIEAGGAAERVPDYDRILSELPTGEPAILARHELEAALGQLPPAVERVALHFHSGGLSLEADGTVVDAGGDWAGAELRVHLNHGFLIDAVAASVGPDITIEAIDAGQPVTLRSADTGTFSVLTMPVRP